MLQQKSFEEDEGGGKLEIGGGWWEVGGWKLHFDWLHIVAGRMTVGRRKVRGQKLRIKN
ncbi:MAG: hypothetical protein IPJ03_17985 [Ignavibacteriales bacterium]|nr:hypothetical protein [Ignavibacteriales bacterium]